MSTMHLNSNNTSSPWSSPKDNPLKRRHTRGNTSHSHSSIRSLSLSPAVSSVSLSDVNHVKSSPGFKPNNNNNNNNNRSQQQQQQQQPHSTRRRETDFQHHDFSHHELNSSYHDFHHHRDDNNNEDYHKPSMKSGHQGGAGAAGFVPSWFGSLRSFAISATSSSRGAFTPLNTSSSSFSSNSSSSSSTTSSPTTSSSSKLHSKKSRGRSSSIYYSSTLHLHDDSDDDSDSGSSSGGGGGGSSGGGSQDEPITDLNGLKENRVRGPRVNWMALDPSLGSLFAGTGGGGAYKPLSTNESDPDLSSSGCEEGEEKGFNCGHGGVEDLEISEAPYRDDQEEEGEGGDEGLRGRGYGGSGSGIDRANSRARAWSKGVSGDATYRDDNNNAKEGAWARAMDDSNVPEVGFTMPVTAPSSTLAFLKSYVPSLGGGGASSDSSAITTSPTTTSPTTTTVTASQTSPAAVSGGGFWSLRKMSMNFLSGNQYASVGDKAANQCDDDDEEEGNESEDQHRPREQGRRTGYRDDYNDHGDDDGGRRELPQRQGDNLSTEMRSATATMTMPPSPVSGGGVTVSYLASMVQNATQVGAQYIPVQVRDQLPVSSRSLKKD